MALVTRVPESSNIVHKIVEALTIMHILSLYKSAAMDHLGSFLTWHEPLHIPNMEIMYSMLLIYPWHESLLALLWKHSNLCQLRMVNLILRAHLCKLSALYCSLS